MLLLLLFAFTASHAQTLVKGKVFSAEDHNPLPGVNIVIKGTTQGSISDAEGSYSISVPNAQSVLVFSFVGYVSQEITVNNQNVIDVTLEPEIIKLNDIVVMGYSSKKRNEITSAITTVSSDKLLDVTSNDIGTMLQGKVPGILVVNSSGTPGATPDIRIRGVSSFNAPQGPLYVVDGIIGGNFDPNDVESITVMKDAGATALYGSQANGGVIVVTTKKGTSRKPTFEFKYTAGVRVADQGHVKMMDSWTLYNYHREYFRDPVYFQIDDRKFKAARPDSLLNVNTDWLGETFKPAAVQNYFLSSSGKSDKLSYYIGAGYYDEDGTFINTYYRRVNLRANTTYQFSNRVTLVNNINLSGSKTRGADYMNIYYSYTNMPWDDPYDANGKVRSFKTADNIWSKDKINPIQAAENSELSNMAYNLDYDLGLDIKITDWLTFTSTNRVSASTNMAKQFYSKLADNLSYYGSGYVSSRTDIDYGGITTNLLKFNFTSQRQSLAGLVGVEAEGDKTDYISCSGTGVSEGLSSPSVASSEFSIAGAPSHSVMQSFISQLNYIYNNRYFLSGSFRVDQSSAFAPKNRTAVFPSLSAAWTISNENFMSNLTFISNLRLKASWGKTGMKDIGPYMYLEQFKYTTQYGGESASVPYQMANPDLTWEQTSQLNAGLEIGLFDRVNIDLNIYRNLTDNLLVYRDLPPSGGFSKQWQNVGKDENKGIELGITSTNIKTTDFLWTPDFSIG
ncbi:MAG: SusC/RagA family TonB-linked outer membrane protein, partial [Bacteroidales bacterium]|nr:SusC/RagA family TonB-linked outer membrane protein [Bacteroidales bacterium]